MKERKKRKRQKTKNTEAIKKKQTGIIKHVKSLAQEKQNFNKARKNSMKGTNLTYLLKNVRYVIVKIKVANLI